MGEVLFPAYRDYHDSRVEANDAVAAILVGSRLAAHTLSLTAGSSATLGQLFPAVEHVNRFNLRNDRARQFLIDADQHVSKMAIPYALATHEDFVMGMLDFIESQGHALKKHGRPIRAWNMHTVLFETLGQQEPTSWLQSFHVLRELRNCLTHAGGGVDDKLRQAIDDMGEDARAGWAVINQGRPPETLEGPDGDIVLQPEHAFMAFAVTKGLGREINSALAQTISPETWAEMAVEDYQSTARHPRNSSGWRRSLPGYVRMHYGPLHLDETRLEQAARRRNLWTKTEWK